ncbi:hypothetical protein GX586_10575, partial [bacterium]|nr:hypothetical protein [bacterium]
MNTREMIDGLRRLSLPRLPRKADEEIARAIHAAPTGVDAVARPRRRRRVMVLTWVAAAVTAVLVVAGAFWRDPTTPAAAPYTVEGRIRVVTVSHDPSGNEHRVTHERTITTVHGDTAM